MLLLLLLELIVSDRSLWFVVLIFESWSHYLCFWGIEILSCASSGRIDAPLKFGRLLLLVRRNEFFGIGIEGSGSLLKGWVWVCLIKTIRMDKLIFIDYLWAACAVCLSERCIRVLISIVRVHLVVHWILLGCDAGWIEIIVSLDILRRVRVLPKLLVLLLLLLLLEIVKVFILLEARVVLVIWWVKVCKLFYICLIECNELMMRVILNKLGIRALEVLASWACGSPNLLVRLVFNLWVLIEIYLPMDIIHLLMINDLMMLWCHSVSSRGKIDLNCMSLMNLRHSALVFLMIMMVIKWYTSHLVS